MDDNTVYNRILDKQMSVGRQTEVCGKTVDEILEKCG